MADSYISSIKLPNTDTYILKDSNAVKKSGDTMTGPLKFSGNTSRALTWEDGTWWQRILTTDDSTAGTAVFTFQQTSDSGSTWTDLFTIKDNGTVVATTFSGNANTATKLAASKTLWGQSFDGSADVTGSMTNVGPSMKLPSGQSAFQFLTSGGSAANGQFGRLSLNTTYANADLTNYVLDVLGKVRIKLPNNATNLKEFIITGSNNNYISLHTSGIQAYNSSGSASLLYLQYYGGNLQIGSSDYSASATRDLYGQFDFKSSTGFNYSGMGAGSDNVARNIWFSYNGKRGIPVYDDDFKYNPSTNTITIGTGSLSATTYSGNAATVTITTHTNTTNGNKTYYLPFLTATSGSLSPHAHSAVYLYETVSNGAISKYDFCFGASAIQGSITLWDGSSHWGNIKTVNLSANRTYDLPNVSGTIALTSSDITGKSASADRLNSNTTVSTKTGLQYTVGQLTIGTADGNAKEGSNNSQALWSYPTGGTAINSNTTANIQNLRLYWGSDGKYFRDIFISPNNSKIYHRAVANGTAGDWRIILDSDNTSSGANNASTLEWSKTYVLAKINGTDIKFTTMAKPTKSDLGLGNVENTALSTWQGSSNIKTVGTITSGTWNGTAIAAAYIGSHAHGNITNSGTIGTAGKKKLVIVGTDNKITTDAEISGTISSQTQSTKFLREDGQWAIPTYTTAGTGLSLSNATLSLAEIRTYDKFEVTPTEGTGNWYNICTINDTVSSPAIISIRAYAHTSIIFTATKGYATNGSLTILNYNNSNNVAYAVITGIRLLSDGTVQAYFRYKSDAPGNTQVNITIRIITSSGNVYPPEKLSVGELGNRTVIKAFENLAVTASGFMKADKFIGALAGNASTASAANLTTTTNAIAYYTNTTGTFGYKESANGALYATTNNGTLSWGTLPIAQGGTGKTSANDAANALLSGLPDWTANPSDDVKLIRRDTSGSAAFGQIKFSTVWNYIKSKADSVYASQTTVNGLLAAADAMIFKGTISSTTGLPNTHNAGWTYRVTAANTYPIVDSNGKYCEVGTLIICIADGTAENPAHWTAVETNEDGAVIGPASVAATNNIAIFDGTTGRIIKDSGTTIANASVNYANSAEKATKDSDNNIINTTYYKANGRLYQNNNYDANTIRVGGFLISGDGYGHVGTGAAHTNFLGNNTTFANLGYIQLATPAWGKNLYYRHNWGGESGNTTDDTANGWLPWTLLLDLKNYNSYVPTLTGTGASGDWNINSATTTKLKTKVSLWGNDFDGSAGIDNSITFNTEKQAIFKINRNASDGGTWAYSPIVIKDKAGTIFARIGVYGTTTTMSYMYIGAGDYSGTTHIRITPTGSLILPNNVTSAYNAANNVALIVGGVQTAQHIEIDKSTILSKSNGTTAGTLNLQTGGGTLSIGASTITTGATLIKFTSLGEGLEITKDENYFGTNYDARIIQMIDTNPNANSSAVDGGIIIRAIGRVSNTDTVQELLRIRNHNGSADWKTGEFQWKTKDVVVETGTTKSWNISISGTAATINAGTSSADLSRPIWFSYSDNGSSYINGKLGYDTDFMYNPSTNTVTIGTGSLTATSYSGNATTSSGVKDYNNSTVTKFGYSTAGMTTTSWLGSWDASTSGEYRLRAITPTNAIKAGIGTNSIGNAEKPIYWSGSAFTAGNGYNVGGNLIAKEYLTVSNGTINSYDATTHTFTITASSATSGRTGLTIANNKVFIPWGYYFILSCEIYSTVAATWNYDENTAIEAGVTGNHSSNDWYNNSTVSGTSIAANTWTKVWYRHSNLDETKNPNHGGIWEYTSFGIALNSNTTQKQYKIRNVMGYYGTDTGAYYSISPNYAITNISRNGTTFTATRLDGSTFTFTQQDNDSVTGVKGNSETNYRTGNVNITAGNIGLGNVENTKLSTWIGTNKITTLGTITTGTWNGSAVDIEYGGTGATTRLAAGLTYGWTAVVQGQTWSRLCYVPVSTSTVGSSILLNIRATRGSVVYNYTLLINAHHNKKCWINILQGSDYSSVKFRGTVDNTGNVYLELQDSAQSIAATATQNVTCYMWIITKGSTEPTLYEVFTSGATLSSGFEAKEITLSAKGGFQTNGQFTGNGAGLTGVPTTSLTNVVTTTAKKFLKDTGSWVQVDWGDLTGKPSTFAPIIGNSATEAMAGNTTVTNVSISADTTTDKNYAIVFSTTSNDGTSPTAAKTEGLQKNSARLYFNPNSTTLSLYNGTTTGTLTATNYSGKAATAGVADSAAYISTPSIKTETAIAEGTRAYQGSGSTWTGTLTSMQYAGILQVCGGYSRGWQIWAQRGDNASESLHWRNPNSAATAWNTERIILDSGNYNTYAAAKSHTHGDITNDGKLTNANRLVWTDGDKKIYAGYHYANSTKIAINSTSEPTENLYVSGKIQFNVSTTGSGDKNFIIKKTSDRYLSIGCGGLQSYNANNTVGTMWLQYSGGTLEIGTGTALTSTTYNATTANITWTTANMTGAYNFKTANTGFNFSGMGAASDNVARNIWFSYNGQRGTPVYDDDFKYNPSTNVLTIGKLTVTGGTTDSSISSSGALTISNTGSSKAITINSNYTLYLNSAASTSILFTKGGADADHELARFGTDGNFVPKANSSYTIGTSSNKWSAIYATNFYGGGANITLSTASRAVVTDSNSKLSVSSVTSTELGYLSGVTSAIQTQLNGKMSSSTAVNKVKTTAKTDNVNYKIIMSAGGASPTSGSDYEVVYDSEITINPSLHRIAGIATIRNNSKYYSLVKEFHARTKWYKITFPYSTATTDSNNDKWFMNSFDIHIGGGYSANAAGVIHVTFYWYRVKNNGAWTVPQASAKFDGILMNKVKLYYRIAEPGILYVNNESNTYNGIWITDLYNDDTGPNLDWTTTTITSCDAITSNTDPALSAYTQIPSVYTYTNNSRTYHIDNTTQISKDLILYSASGDSPALMLKRASDSTLTDWKIYVTGGKLSFCSALNASTWTERAYFADNSGNFTTTGTVTATGFNGPLTGNVTGDVSGTAANVTGTVTVAHGGTGATSFTDGCVIIPSTTSNVQTFSSSGLKITGAQGANITLAPDTASKTMTISSTTGAMTISTTTAALGISTTTGALTVQTNGASGGNLILQAAGNSGTVTLKSTKSSVSILSGTTMSIQSTTSTSISSTTTMSISGTQGTTINSGTGYATVFKINNTEKARFNPSGMLELNDTGTQGTHKLYVNGDSAFNGKIAIGEQVSNVITEKVYMKWNETDLSLDFIFA